MFEFDNSSNERLISGPINYVPIFNEDVDLVQQFLKRLISGPINYENLSKISFVLLWRSKTVPWLFSGWAADVLTAGVVR